MDNPRWVVLKFGGTSVSSRTNWEQIAAQLQQRSAEGLRPIVVCSAFSTVSNTLEALLTAAVNGQHAELLDELEQIHRVQAEALDVDPECLEPYLKSLRRISEGISLIQELSPRVRARLMAHGEFLSSTIGAAFLNANGIATRWVDARSLLQAEAPPHENLERGYLSATCIVKPSEALQQEHSQHQEAVLLTQGFVARNPAGHTVLLGRGGSDTSAAYIAALFEAERCEIWTDVPGLYTANPHLIPDARLLLGLGYDEAQEIASMGAKVLHPRCIPILREHLIPLEIRCTTHPELEHTRISRAAAAPGAQVKSITARTGITLISMNTHGMWQQVGFLAKVFGCFQAHGLSVDLVSTSEMNVTASLDTASMGIDSEKIEALLADLSAYCEARAIGPCAAVSLVGRKIRALFHTLGPAFKLFEEQRIHLVSQAASDLNFTFVVDEDQSDRLVRQLHNLFFSDSSKAPNLGPSWQDRFGAPARPITQAPWWSQRREELLELAAQHSPAYIYSLPSVRAAIERLRTLSSLDGLFYAIKANRHPDVLHTMVSAGLGFECVSPGEIRHVLDLFPQIDRKRILFTPNFAPASEYAFALDAQVNLTVDNLHPVKQWPELFKGRSLIIRVDPGQGRGHHAFVKTAGAQSKFGLWPSQIPEVRDRLEALGASVIGLHAHSGSGIREPHNWREIAEFLAGVAQSFPNVGVLNLGGGLGVIEKPGQHALDLQAVEASLSAFKAEHPQFKLWMEPGRYLVATAGVLLTRVTQRKQKGSMHYVGVDTGMNSLIRPALYGAYHQIVNLSRLDAPATLHANIVGPICESGDTIGYERNIAEPSEGDILLIATAGAYGRVMSSDYNLRSPAVEITLE
jgi:diaminopimelate decarboxylase/aspartate kinase